MSRSVKACQPRHVRACACVRERRLAYDGKGNAVVRTAANLDSAVAALGG